MGDILEEHSSNAFLSPKNTMKDLHILSKIEYSPFNIKVILSSARESDSPASQTWMLGLVVDFQDLPMVCLVFNKRNVIIFLFALLRLWFSGKIPRMHSLAHIDSVIPVICDHDMRSYPLLQSKKPGSVGSPIGSGIKCPYYHICSTYWDYWGCIYLVELVSHIFSWSTYTEVI